jgi:hypothetical protein
METEGSGRLAGRPRPWLMVALAAVVGLALVTWLVPGKSAAPAGTPSNPRTQHGKKGVESIDPADLDVRLEELKRPQIGTEASDRNPFRFYVKPPPPSPPPPAPGSRGSAEAPPPPPQDTGPPPPPPIPLKYIGFMDVPKVGKVAAFSDCRMTMRGREGEVIAGQYRLVRIGVESVVMEYVDGRGRTTIRMSGQECVGK